MQNRFFKRFFNLKKFSNQTQLVQAKPCQSSIELLPVDKEENSYLFQKQPAIVSKRKIFLFILSLSLFAAVFIFLTPSRALAVTDKFGADPLALPEQVVNGLNQLRLPQDAKLKDLPTKLTKAVVEKVEKIPGVIKFSTPGDKPLNNLYTLMTLASLTSDDLEKLKSGMKIPAYIVKLIPGTVSIDGTGMYKDKPTKLFIEMISLSVPSGKTAPYVIFGRL